MLLIILSISIQVLFSPSGGIRNAIKKELRNAENKIDVAIYILTDRELSNSLIKASERGVDVRVVMDGCNSEEIKYSKHRFLSAKGVNVRLDKTHVEKGEKYPGIMHNKFVIIDSSILITGSYNWTHSAEVRNDENILIIKDADEVIKKYRKKFFEIWNRSSSLEYGDIPIIDPYNAVELRRNINRWVNVKGKPTSWNISHSGHLFIDFGRGSDAFTFLLWKEGVEELKKSGFNFEKLGKDTVILEGKLIDHEKYGLEIVTDNPETIKFK